MDCSFDSCNLSNAKLMGVSLRNTLFANSKLVGVNFSTIHSQMGLKFENCALDYAIFQDLKLESISFQKCSLKNSDFSSSFLRHSEFLESNLDSASFNNCNLENADFRGALNYHIDIHHTFIKGAVFSSPEVLALLSSFDIKIE